MGIKGPTGGDAPVSRPVTLTERFLRYGRGTSHSPAPRSRNQDDAGLDLGSVVQRMTGYRRVPGCLRDDFAVDAGPAPLDTGDRRAEQLLGPGSQVVVGIFVHVERERLGVLVRVADGQRAVGPLHQQQLRAGALGDRRLRRQLRAPGHKITRSH